MKQGRGSARIDFPVIREGDHDVIGVSEFVAHYCIKIPGFRRVRHVRL